MDSIKVLRDSVVSLMDKKLGTRLKYNSILFGADQISSAHLSQMVALPERIGGNLQHLDPADPDTFGDFIWMAGYDPV